MTSTPKRPRRKSAAAAGFTVKREFFQDRHGAAALEQFAVRKQMKVSPAVRLIVEERLQSEGLLSRQ